MCRVVCMVLSLVVDRFELPCSLRDDEILYGNVADARVVCLYAYSCDAGVRRGGIQPLMSRWDRQWTDDRFASVTACSLERIWLRCRSPLTLPAAGQTVQV